ncbi:MAG: SUMF1/EgtB/PvdO family nonheme iron enzyme [Polyangiaceae bacterium]|nr:SUMF1/EgtB/PvdO family nonheme iron enzyme [Polyangiaceae bacterium]
MRTRSLRPLAASAAPTLFVILAACGNSSPGPTGGDGGATPPSSAAPTTAGASQSSVQAAVVDAPAPAASADPEACPAGMVLVDGDYCTEVEQRCKAGKSWYAKWNDKTICLEFEAPATCVGKKEHRRYCMDKFEYPNREGTRPTVMNDFPQAQRLCAEQGKRMCTETEWTMACEGPEYKPYPYGYARDPEICKGDQQGVEPEPEGHTSAGDPFYKFASKNKEIRAAELERLWQGVPSGSQPKCVSDYGVYDMPGNADELASAESKDSKYDNVTTGGPWRYGVRNQCRPKIYTHNEGFAYYYLSFRCCAEADGKPTDPRSPKQIHRKERWNGGQAPVRDSWDGNPMPDPVD